MKSLLPGKYVPIKEISQEYSGEKGISPIVLSAANNRFDTQTLSHLQSFHPGIVLLADIVINIAEIPR